MITNEHCEPKGIEMELEISCQCGKLKGRVTNLAPANGNHIICMCHDCQALAKHLSQQDKVLYKHGGTK